MKTPIKSLSPSTSKIHFVGIGGCGMAPLAAYAAKAGYSVQGSDASTSIYVDQLREFEIRIFSNHDPAHLSDIDLVVYSSSISEDNVELVKAQVKNIPCLHRSEFLARLLEKHKAITVAGTHGKTTTASMITHMLTACDLAPQAIIGGLFNESNQGYILDSGDLFVAEADESDGSFLNYSPFINVIHNIDEDHLDHFGSLENIESIFAKYLALTREDGVAVVGWDNKIIRKLAKNYAGPLLSYGKQIGSDVRLLSYEVKAGQMSFDVMVFRERIKGKLNALGSYNLQNMLSALAVASYLELDIEKAAESFHNYNGVRRRLSLVRNETNFKVYDDYAHNPVKIASVLSGLREAYPNATIHALFEPHRYSRFDSQYGEFLKSFQDIDTVDIFPVFASGEDPSISQNLPEDFARALSSSTDSQCQSHASYDAFLKTFKANEGEENIYITLGAGPIYKLAEKLANF